MPLEIAVFCASSPHGPLREHYLDLARTMGRRLAEEGYRVLHGGGPGMMQAVSEGAFRAGGDVYCVSLELDPPQYDDHNGTELHKMLTPRQLALINGRDGFIALPGGVGTLFEAAEIVAKMTIGEIPMEKPLVCVGPDWQHLEAHYRHMIERGLVYEDSIGSLRFAPDVESAIAILNEALRP